jgi:hypothetical protein
MFRAFLGMMTLSPPHTISKIPDEIWENVFLEDVLTDKDLCKIALVDRRFGRLAQVSLYDQVSLPLLSKSTNVSIALSWSIQSWVPMFGE